MPEDLAAEHRDAATLADDGRAGPAGAAGRPAVAARLGAAGDRMAHQLLVAELNRLYPDDDVRSEEGLEHVAGTGRLWIIDPLDGTREFRQPERTDWAVHVAMAVGGVAVVGAVALPALDIVLATAEPPVLPPSRRGERAAGRGHPEPAPDVAYEVTEAIGGVMIPMGSAGAKIAAVILGAAEVYVHAGGQYEWDSCAPVAVAMASGLHASRLDGDTAALRRPRRLAARPRRVPPGVRGGRAGRHDATASAVLVGALVDRQRPDRSPAGACRRSGIDRTPPRDETGFCRDPGAVGVSRWRARSRPEGPSDLGWSRIRPSVLLRDCGSPYRRSR